MRPLVVIPAYVTRPEDVTVIEDCVASIRRTVSDSVDVLIVDDGSPLGMWAEDADLARAEVHYKDENTGFSKTVNVGLQRAAEEGRDAVLMNADMKMLTPGWVKHCQRTTAPDGTQADVVGALLLYPETNLIQHAGIYLSMLTRTFDHLHRCSPHNLPAALVKKVCPVTGAFQYIRHETLTTVGLYDEGFYMGWEDVDFCIRVFKAGRVCVYTPNVKAIHYEQMFRGRKSEKLKKWESASFIRLMLKYQDQSFAGLVPNWE